jgi:hypothetical protein
MRNPQMSYRRGPVTDVSLLCLRVAKLCGKIKVGDFVRASKLWNCIDNYPEPERMWDTMLFLVPWAFDDDRCCNSINLQYHGDVAKVVA